MARDAGGNIRVDGLSQTLDLQETRKARLQDLSGPMKSAGIEVFKEIQRNFANQGSDEGPWAALKPLTLRRKLRAGGSPLILIGAPAAPADVRRKRKKAAGRASGAGAAGALMRDWDIDPSVTSVVVKS